MTRVLVGLACPLLLPHALTGSGEEARNEDLPPDGAASLLAEVGAAMAERLLQVATLPQQLQELIISKAEGNPFFVQETLKHPIEDAVGPA